MAKCPKCGAEIDHLNAFSLEENKQEVCLDETGNLDWGVSETVELSCVKIEFECPEIIYKNDGSSTDPQIKALLTG